MEGAYQEYGFSDQRPECTSAYLIPSLLKLAGPLGADTRVLDVGCGNGYLAGKFLSLGCQVVGIDLSETGIAIARAAYHHGRFEVLPANQDLLARLDEAPFDLVVSTEVVEHLYAPRDFIRGCFTALKPGGTFICSTPYNGYLKNVAVAVTNKFDRHVNPLWDGGHIKFWSVATLSKLYSDAGFSNLRFRGAGRLPLLWKSMLLAGTRPH